MSSSLALDGSDRWWQSPTLQYSPAYQQVTITINLKRIYQVAISMTTYLHIYVNIYIYMYLLSTGCLHHPDSGRVSAARQLGAGEVPRWSHLAALAGHYLHYLHTMLDNIYLST